MHSFTRYHDRTGKAAADSELAPQEARPGRSTLTDELYREQPAATAAAAPASRPLFEGGASWEAIDHDEDHDESDAGADDAADAAHEQSQLAPLLAAPAEGDAADTADALAPSGDGLGPAPSEPEAAAADPEPSATPDLAALVEVAPPADAATDHDRDDDHDRDHDDDHDHDDAASGAPAAQFKTTGKDPDPDDAPSAKAAKQAKRKQPPLETKLKKSRERHFAAQDRYNRASVRANSLSKNKQVKKRQINRAGVRINNRDIFELVGDSATRYLIRDFNKAEPMDIVTKAYLAKGNRMAINPAHVRDLKLPGQTDPVSCVFVWVGSRGAGWMPISSIKGNAATIRKKVNAHNAKWGPAAAPAANSTRYVFLDATADNATARAKRAGAGPSDKGLFIKAGQQKPTANRVHDYLQHVDRPTSGLGLRDYYNITMNLPSGKAAPIAIDTAKPGDLFFVPRGKQFFRQVGLYKLKQTKTRLLQTWVYGFLSKSGKNGPEADTRRRGWVPLRVVSQG